MGENSRSMVVCVSKEGRQSMVWAVLHRSASRSGYVLLSTDYTGQTTVNKKVPSHYITSINDKVYRPL